MNSSHLNSSSPAPSVQCDAITNSSLLAFTVIPLLLIAFNFLVISAVLCNRNRLRHNFVYLYVINTSMANILFGVFSLYHIANISVAFERNWGAPDPFRADVYSLLGWWSFRTAMLSCSFIAMSGSLLALTYGIRKSSYFVGRSVRNIVEDQSRTNQRTKMLGIISFNWFVPIALCIASAAGWSCVQYCKCTPAYYGPDVFPCQTDIFKECSSFVLPQANSFIMVTVVTWFLECVGIVFMIAMTMKNYIEIMSAENDRPSPNVSVVCVSERGADTRSRESRASLPSFPSGTSNGNSTTTVNVVPGRHQEEDAMSCADATNKRVHCLDEKVTEDERPCASCSKMPPLNSNIKLLLVISTLFILCTLPVMFSLLIDVVSEEIQLSFYGRLLPFLVCLIYGSIAPIVLVYYMSGLRTAVLHTLFRISCFKRTTRST